MNISDSVELHEIPTDKPIAIYGAGEAGDNLRKDWHPSFTGLHFPKRHAHFWCIPPQKSVNYF